MAVKGEKTEELRKQELEVLLDLVLGGDQSRPHVSFCAHDQATVLDAGIGHRDSSSVLHTDGIPARWWHHARVTFTCLLLFSYSCLTLLEPLDCSPPGSSVLGISRAKILQWVAISFCRGSSWPRDRTQVYLRCMWVLYCWATWEGCACVNRGASSLGCSRSTPDAGSAGPAGWTWRGGLRLKDGEE